MCEVEKLIEKCGKLNAIKNGRVIPNFMDTVNATIKVCSGDRDEVNNIAKEVEKYNNSAKLKN